MLGIDTGRLQQTVSRFNGFAKSGVDQDFHPASTNGKLLPAQGRAPTAVSAPSKSRPSMASSYMRQAGASVGLLTDAHARAIQQRRHAIPGRYSSGNVAAA